MNGRLWTKKELRYLKKHYSDTPAWKIASDMGRTKSSICGQVAKLELYKSKEFPVESVSWCALLDRAINESLRKERRPVCAVEHGCWYCDQKYQKQIEVVDRKGGSDEMASLRSQ